MTPEGFDPDNLTPGTRIGAYVVRGTLGQGGSSSVYEVESAEGHRFALKMCRYHGGAHGTSAWRVDQRYSRSIACLQLLKGRRNVAELYAHDRYPDPLHGHQYLVQEMIPDGLLITDWVKRKSPTLRKVVGAFVELAELCGVMASKGICHRDLKPANILVTPDGTPKVIDFESATCPHVEPVTRRAASEVPGTGGWQCPEVCPAILEEESKRKRKNKKSKDALGFHPWADLLSLGVVFYECLTGESSFDASETPIQPVQFNTAVPLGLNKVVMKLLEKQPKARYREGAEVAKDLRKLLKKVKDKRWDKPFKQPVPDEEEAPVLPFVSPVVPTPEPVPVNETNESETGESRGLLPESEPLAGTVLDFGDAGKYTLEQRLGRGGMGEVYLARQAGAAGFVQLVAIKRVRPGGRSWDERSFVDEAGVLSRLRHPNIAHVYAFHQWQGSYYLVMEYVEGHSLHALLELARRKGHRFSESVACAVMAEVADALDYAHQVKDDAGRPLNIVHRDVSPTNILITETGRVVLVDFGVAFHRGEARIPTSANSTIIKGKLPYVSPEQVKHQPLDGRSDLFSVGTILAEMLTGEAPFGWTLDNLTLLRISGVTPEYVASHLPGVSKPLRAICQKLLALHPDERFATGGELAMALRRHARLYEGPQGIRAEVEKLQASPDAKVRPAAAVAAARSLSEVRRARRVVALAGAAMLAMLAFSSWYIPRRAVPFPTSPPLRGPGVSLPLPPPEKSIAPDPPDPLPPNGPLVDKPESDDGAVAAGPGPAHRRNVGATPPSALQSGERLALTVVLGDQKARIPLTLTAPSAGRIDGVAHVSLDPDEKDLLRDELVAAKSQLAVMTASYVKVSGEVLSPKHNLAALFATGNIRLTQFVRVSRREFNSGDISANVSIWKPGKGVGSSAVALVVDLTNPDDAPPWEVSEGRLVSHVRASTGVPVVRAMPRVISPGEQGRVALVFDRADIDDGEAMPILVELLRDQRPAFAIELSTNELKQVKSRWPEEQ